MMQFAASGNVKEVERAWMGMLDPAPGALDEIVECVPVLEKLAERDKLGEAATLAWTTIEMLKEAHPPADVIRVAGPMLLCLSKSGET